MTFLITRVWFYFICFIFKFLEAQISRKNVLMVWRMWLTVGSGCPAGNQKHGASTYGHFGLLRTFSLSRGPLEAPLCVSIFRAVRSCFPICAFLKSRPRGELYLPAVPKSSKFLSNIFREFRQKCVCSCSNPLRSTPSTHSNAMGISCRSALPRLKVTFFPSSDQISHFRMF